jgi:membrane protease YdiL (CAAX protease family)
MEGKWRRIARGSQGARRELVANERPTSNEASRARDEPGPSRFFDRTLVTTAEKPLSIGPLLAIGLVLAAKLGLISLFTVLIAIRAGRGGDWEHAAEILTSDPFTLAAVQGVVFGGTLLVGLLLTAQDVRVRDALHLTRPRVTQVIAGVVAGVALALVLSEVDNVLREFRPMTEAELAGRARLLGDPSITHRVGLFLAIAVVAPITEETLFRGLLLFGLATTRTPAKALVLTSVLFGLAHVNVTLDADWPTLVVTTLAALYLGGIALGGRSITPAVVIHATHNSIALIHPSSLRVEGLNVLGERVYHLPPMLVSASVAALFLAALFFRKPQRTTPRP